jgi:modification methylase
MGSGTTAVAAKANGHRFIGFELSPQYVQMANDRLSRTTRKGFAVQGDLF